MHWLAAWGYLPIDFGVSIGSLENVTQRTIIKNNLSGNHIRILFSNKYGKKPLTLNRVTAGQYEESDECVTRIISVTSDKKECITLYPGEERYSDAIEWSISGGTDIVLSVYIAEQTDISSVCQTWAAQSWHTVYAQEKDATQDYGFTGAACTVQFPFLDLDANKANVMIGISQVEIDTACAVREFALFGDSITHMSYFSDSFMQQMHAKYPGTLTVLNRGIGGNRLLHDATWIDEMPGNGHCFGMAGESRFEPDLFQYDHPNDILFLEGINDLMHPYQFAHTNEIVSAEQLQKSVEILCHIAHAHDSRIYIGTIMPFRIDAQNDVFSEAEAERKKYNQWVRMQTAADNFIDFAAAVEDTARPDYMWSTLHKGDGLHPGVLGGKIMAETLINKLGL